MPTGDAPQSVAVNPSGRFAYVANENSDLVSTFSIDQATGGLTTVSLVLLGVGDGPRSIAIAGRLQ
jgi:DNA-binding beta-propeller fold protein YncE